MKRVDQRNEMNNAYLTIHRADDTGQFDQNKHFSISNASKGGVRFCSNDDVFNVGEKIELDLYIGDKLSHHATGRICYHDEDSSNNFYGISFLDKYLHI
jgi:hypothetical protein